MHAIVNTSRTKVFGSKSVRWMFTFAAAAYNLIRIRNLTTAVS